MIFRSRKTYEEAVKAEAEKLLPERFAERLARYVENPLYIRRAAAAFYGLPDEKLGVDSYPITWIKRGIRAFANETGKSGARQ